MHRPATVSDLTPTIFDVFARWIAQRPGLDTHNYYSDARDTAGIRAFRNESLNIAKDGRRARAALAQAQTYPFDAAAMLEAFRAFSGRLQPIVYHRAVNQRAVNCPSCKVAPGKEHKANCTGGLEELRADLEFEYCTGQYWPTEYRKAATSVLETYCEAARPKTPPAPGQRFETIEDMAQANYNKGGHWFSPENKRFFRSRILPAVYQGKDHVFFVSSEKGPYGPRMFTARVFDCATANVSTLGEFNASTRAEAIEAARTAARRDRTGDHYKPAAQGDKCDVCAHYRDYCTGKERDVQG